ncbi:MepB family protein [Marivirga harenae]|uniref:MepB family protein n=1 Tax=Marivirga harenae TaxID=2010992 RepID=UPI0026E0BFCE|nr:MepB family protein [Marivirga harenae]WKV12352.1 MepB family protein [Marivirga harenae]|tara:strand:+ start:48126 stop:48620 length:495 start_codon:yes stop_codon:yes gene_type:complete
MNNNLKQINTQVYEKCGLKMSDFQIEDESKEYEACRFELNGRSIISRKAKITPKKAGQFVVYWKRNSQGIIAPLEEADRFDFYVVSVITEKQLGQFVFPKSVLIEKGILSTSKKEGKRAFRVYPNWEIVKSIQAKRTQKWQQYYFYEINDSTDFKKVKELYATN